MEKMPVSTAQELEKAFPEFVDALQRNTSHIVRFQLDDFEKEPDLLYNCVWYALSYGRKVVFEPPH